MTTAKKIACIVMSTNETTPIIIAPIVPIEFPWSVFNLRTTNQLKKLIIDQRLSVCLIVPVTCVTVIIKHFGSVPVNITHSWTDKNVQYPLIAIGTYRMISAYRMLYIYSNLIQQKPKLLIIYGENTTFYWFYYQINWMNALVHKVKFYWVRYIHVIRSTQHEI